MTRLNAFLYTPDCTLPAGRRLHPSRDQSPRSFHRHCYRDAHADNNSPTFTNTFSADFAHSDDHAYAPADVCPFR